MFSGNTSMPGGWNLRLYSLGVVKNYTNMFLCCCCDEKSNEGFAATLLVCAAATAREADSLLACILVALMASRDVATNRCICNTDEINRIVMILIEIRLREKKARSFAAHNTIISTPS